MTAALEVHGLKLGYGPATVIDGVDLTVPEGSVVVLIGANGAGKSTILRGLSGLMPTRGGSVHFLGQQITNASAHRIARAGLVHVPEGRQIFAEMSVAENLAIGGYGAPVRDLRRRQDLVLARLPRLAERLIQSAGALSGGEQQMLAIGRALMAEPKLLLLDEPSLGLAPIMVDAIFRIIADLKREGRTILLVEQNARAALAIADYAYVLEQGRITLEGTGAEVVGSEAVTAAYLG